MTFADLHRPGDPFVLPNFWDVASAKLFESAGFPAVASTSLGVAAAAGLLDGMGLIRDVTANLVRDVRAAGLSCYLSLDLENGFSNDPGEVASYIAELDVDGVNIEDHTRGQLIDREVAIRKIAAIRAAAPRVFINARTDVYLLGGSGSDALATALDRLQAFVDVGADGVFLPGTSDPHVIETVTSRIDRPLNVLASASLTRSQLGSLGVARISTGSLPYRTALRQALDTVFAVRDGAALGEAVGYPVIQGFARKDEGA